MDLVLTIRNQKIAAVELMLPTKRITNGICSRLPVYESDPATFQCIKEILERNSFVEHIALNGNGKAIN